VSRTVVVAGALAGRAGRGGEAWVRLGYVLGLKELGVRVHFVEQIDPALCDDRALAVFEQATTDFGLDATLVCGGGTYDELAALADEADLLVNVSGNLTCESVFSRFRRRAYVDVDPGYTQLWLDAGHSVGRAREHHVHFTVGLGVAGGTAHLPDGGIHWRPTLPPVSLSAWPFADELPPDRLTTVGSWRGGYGRVEQDGELHGQKAHEFRKLAELPRATDVVLEAALSFAAEDAADRERLLAGGWTLRDPASTSDAASYRSYVASSAGELSPAQGVYVSTRSGWFSDRTACYLASGRPAIVQDTGLDGRLPVGDGLLTFATADEAVACIDDVRERYSEHRTAARELAEQHLAAGSVLERLLAEALP
jgi:hypothetical protein